ncbi:uncharacterized protein ABDE67_020643 [Symphorus nematophorus]
MDEKRTGPLGEHEGDSVNMKSYHSINVQMTCDHQLIVTSVEAKWPGSLSDSWIFTESLLGHQVSKCRVRTKITFGVIKSHFSSLHGLRVSPEQAFQTITACVVLHNIAVIRKEKAPHVTLGAPDVVDPITLNHSHQTGHN